MNFEHLDPPAVPQPDAELLDTVKTGARTRRRHRLIGTGAGAGAVALALVVALLFATSGGPSPHPKRVSAAGEGEGTTTTSELPTTLTTPPTTPAPGAAAAPQASRSAKSPTAPPSRSPGSPPPFKGSGILFIRSSDRTRLMVVDPDGSNQRLVAKAPLSSTTGYQQGFAAADWSPDRTEIVAFAFEKYGQDMYLVSAAGGDPRRIASDQSGYASFSPDGRRLAVVPCRGFPSCTGSGSLTVMNVDGSAAQVVCCSQGQPVPYLSRPSWSRDGNQVFFAGYVEDSSATTLPNSGPVQNSGLWSMNADGTGLREIPGFDGARDPSVSPDGIRVAFWTQSCNDTGCTNQQIFVGNTDGTDIHRIHAGSMPVWSPDGTRLAFGGETMNSDGSDATSIPGMDGAAVAWG